MSGAPTPEVTFKIRGNDIEMIEFSLGDSDFKRIMADPDLLIKQIINKMPRRTSAQRTLQGELLTIYAGPASTAASSATSATALPAAPPAAPVTAATSATASTSATAALPAPPASSAPAANAAAANAANAANAAASSAAATVPSGASFPAPVTAAAPATGTAPSGAATPAAPPGAPSSVVVSGLAPGITGMSISNVPAAPIGKPVSLLYRGKLIIDNSDDPTKYEDPIIANKYKAIKIEDLMKMYLEPPAQANSPIKSGVLSLRFVIVKPKLASHRELQIKLVENKVKYKPQLLGYEVSPFIRYIGTTEDRYTPSPFTMPWITDNMQSIDELLNTINLDSKKNNTKTKKVVVIAIDEVKRAARPVLRKGGAAKRNITHKRKH